MDIQSLRRDRLREWIRDHYDGNVSRYAEIVGKKQSQIADMLDERKSFGEKVAGALEGKTPGMPSGYLRHPDSGTTPKSGWSFHFALRFEQDRWNALPPGQRRKLEAKFLELIELCEVEHPASTKSGSRTGKRRAAG